MLCFLSHAHGKRAHADVSVSCISLVTSPQGSELIIRHKFSKLRMQAYQACRSSYLRPEVWLRQSSRPSFTQYELT